MMQCSRHKTNWSGFNVNALGHPLGAVRRSLTTAGEDGGGEGWRAIPLVGPEPACLQR